MKHRFYTRAVSLFLIFGLLLTGLALPVFAVPASGIVSQADSSIAVEERASSQEPPFDIFLPFSYLLVGQTKQISYTINASGVSITWSSANTSIATVNSSGAVTGVSEGFVQITAAYTDPSTGVTTSESGWVYVYDSLGIVNHNSYYIMNYASGRYLSRASALEADPTVNTRPRDPSMLTQWQMEKQSDSTFQLVNVYSIYGKVLNVTGEDINASTNTGADNQKFAVYRIRTGSYKGLYYIRYGDSYVAQASDYSLYLTDTVTGSAVWSFMAVDKHDADMFSTSYWETNANTLFYENVMNGLGYDAEATNLVDKTASDARSHMLSSEDVFVLVSHGGEGVAAFYDSNGACTGALAVNSSVFPANNTVGADRVYIEDFAHNQLASLRVVLYLGCLTGADATVNGEEFNLVDATFAKGAHFVLGTTARAFPPMSTNFLTGFLVELNNNQSDVFTCVQKGTAKVKEIQGEDAVYPLYYVGDKKQYLD